MLAAAPAEENAYAEFLCHVSLIVVSRSLKRLEHRVQARIYRIFRPELAKQRWPFGYFCER